MKRWGHGLVILAIVGCLLTELSDSGSQTQECAGVGPLFLRARGKGNVTCLG